MTANISLFVICVEAIKLTGFYMMAALAFNELSKQTTTELLATGQIISEWPRKEAFNYTEIINNHGLKQGTECQIVRFITHFSLKSSIQF